MKRPWSCCGCSIWENVAGYQAANLPYGKQRKLEIARALATDPKLLLLGRTGGGHEPPTRPAS